MRYWLAAALAAVLAVGAGCDGALHRMQDREARPETAPPAGAVAWSGDGEPAPARADVRVTRELLARGEDRFDRACAACHGVLGDGDSDVARAMAGRRPGSLVDSAASALSDARIATAIEVGYGAMPALADVLPPRDRIAVLHFVRALQRREVALGGLSAADRAAATGALGGAP